MSEDKVIKDLKERNNSLSNQFRLRDIRVNCLEHQNIEKNKEIERLHSIIKEVREYIEEHTKYKNYGYIDQKQWLDKYFDLRNLKEILDKEEEQYNTYEEQQDYLWEQIDEDNIELGE